MPGMPETIFRGSTKVTMLARSIMGQLSYTIRIISALLVTDKLIQRLMSLHLIVTVRWLEVLLIVESVFTRSSKGISNKRFLLALLTSRRRRGRSQRLEPFKEKSPVKRI